jgi:D-serine deaminase-like pyridoxal phosphate-dependent protein
MLDWDQVRRALKDERLPALLVDVAAFDRNVERIASAATAAGKTIRVGSKSIRSVALLSRVLAHGPAFEGVLSFTYDEAAFLLEQLEPAKRDVLVAYPSVQRAQLKRFAQAAEGAKRALAVIDALEHLEALHEARRDGAPIAAVIDLDVSLKRAGLHLGVRRSPLRSADDVARLLRECARYPSVRIEGLLAYEAHIAGLPGAGLAQRAFRSMAIPDVRKLREGALAALREAGVERPLVNAGGTGSLHASLADPSATEVTVGSGFLCSHLFDGASDLDLEPAIFVALEVGRVPDAQHVTANGGGYIASGEAGPSRLPQPYLPEGMKLVGMEGAGEVQTPLVIGGASRAPRIGDPVLLRPAKAGEIAERFAEHLWLEGDRVTHRTPTYRGQGQTFL